MLFRSCAAAGVRWLDAPVTGGTEGARAGSLSVLVGGDAADLERARPLLEMVGGRITHLGPLGAGQQAKAVNQVLVAGSYAAVAEALDRLLDTPGLFVFGSNDYNGPVLKNPLAYFAKTREGKREGAELPTQDLRELLVDAGWVDLNNAEARLSVNGVTVHARGTNDAHIHLDDYASVAGSFDTGALALGVTLVAATAFAQAPAAGTNPTTVCGLPIPAPAALPPADSPPVIYQIVPCFPTQGNTSTVEPETYLFYIRLRPSLPSQGRWVPYDDTAETTIREDFSRLWGTNFLDDLSIETTDYVFSNGVVGKLILYNMEERERVKVVDYQGSKEIDRTKIDEQLRDRKIELRLDSFVDLGAIRRVETVLREMMAAKGFTNAVVTHKTTSVAGGPKLVNVTFQISEGPKIKIRRIDFVGNTAMGDGPLQRALKENKPKGVLSFIANHGWSWTLLEVLHFVGLCLLFAVLMAVNFRMLGMMRGVSFAALHRLLPIATLFCTLRIWVISVIRNRHKLLKHIRALRTFEHVCWHV